MKKIILILCLVFTYNTVYAKDTCKQVPINIKQKGSILFNMQKCTLNKPQDSMYKHILQTELNNPEINKSQELKSKIDLMLIYEKYSSKTESSHKVILHDNNGPLRNFGTFVLIDNSKNKSYLYNILDNKTYLKVERYSPKVEDKYTDNIHEFGNSVFYNIYLFKNAKMDDIYTYVMKNIYSLLYIMKDENEYKNVFPKAIEVMKSDYFNKTEYLIPIFDARNNIKVKKESDYTIFDNGGSFTIVIQKKGNDVQLMFSAGNVFYQTLFNF